MSCELGQHASVFTPTQLYWGCKACAQVAQSGRWEAVHARNPYRFLPYYALALVFIAFLLVYLA